MAVTLDELAAEEEAPTGAPVPFRDGAARWLGPLTLVAIFLASLGPTIEFDVWFRIRYGQDILSTHSIPRYAPYLWPTPALAPVFQSGNDWLFCVLVAILQGLGGMAALSLTKALLVTLLFGLLWRQLGHIGLPSGWRCAVLALTYWLY